MTQQERIRRRRARVHALREQGLTLPAIAAAVGRSRSTVAADLAAERPEVCPVPGIQDEHGHPVAPAQPGNTLAAKSGVYSERLLRPRAEELRAELQELVPVSTAADGPAIELLAWNLARIERANAYLAEVGILDGRGEPRPVLKVLSTWERTAARLFDQLGLTPPARAKLGVDVQRLRRGEAARRHIEGKGSGEGEG